MSIRSYFLCFMMSLGILHATESSSFEKNEESYALSSAQVTKRKLSDQDCHDSFPLSLTKKKARTENTDFFMSPEFFESKRCQYRKANTAEKVWHFFERAHAEGGNKTAWFTDILLTPYTYDEGGNFITLSLEAQIEKAKKELDLKDALGFFTLPISFSSYDIFHKEKGVLMGKLHYKPAKPGFIDTSLYLFNAFRGQGYGTETMTAALEKVIKPALGQPYMVDDSFIDGSDTRAEDIQCKKIPHFSGTFGFTNTFLNKASYRMFLKSGLSVQWIGLIPHGVYPLDPSENDMTLEETHALGQIIDIFRDALPPELYDDVTPRELFQNAPLLLSAPNLKILHHNLGVLLKSSDVNTFISSLQACNLMDLDIIPSFINKLSFESLIFGPLSSLKKVLFSDG